MSKHKYSSIGLMRGFAPAASAAAFTVAMFVATFMVATVGIGGFCTNANATIITDPTAFDQKVKVRVSKNDADCFIDLRLAPAGGRIVCCNSSYGEGDNATSLADGFSAPVNCDMGKVSSCMTSSINIWKGFDRWGYCWWSYFDTRTGSEGVTGPDMSRGNLKWGFDPSTVIPASSKPSSGSKQRDEVVGQWTLICNDGFRLFPDQKECGFKAYQNSEFGEEDSDDCPFGQMRGPDTAHKCIANSATICDGYNKTSVPEHANAEGEGKASSNIWENAEPTNTYSNQWCWKYSCDESKGYVFAKDKDGKEDKSKCELMAGITHSPECTGVAIGGECKSDSITKGSCALDTKQKLVLCNAEECNKGFFKDLKGNDVVNLCIACNTIRNTDPNDCQASNTSLNSKEDEDGDSSLRCYVGYVPTYDSNAKVWKCVSDNHGPCDSIDVDKECKADTVITKGICKAGATADDPKWCFATTCAAGYYLAQNTTGASIGECRKCSYVTGNAGDNNCQDDKGFLKCVAPLVPKITDGADDKCVAAGAADAKANETVFTIDHCCKTGSFDNPTELKACMTDEAAAAIDVATKELVSSVAAGTTPPPSPNITNTPFTGSEFLQSRTYKFPTKTIIIKYTCAEGDTAAKAAAEAKTKSDAILAKKNEIAARAGEMQTLRDKYKGAGQSVWKNETGGLNMARVASDGIAAAALGTVGGIVTFNIVKKNQLKYGFDDLDCVANGNFVANWGDQFDIGGATTRAECVAATGGKSDAFVWAASNSQGLNFSGLVEDTKDPKNNSCWAKIEFISKDPKLNMTIMTPRYFRVGMRVTCGEWLDENAVRNMILDAKKSKRTLATVGGAVGGAAIGFGAMELFGNKALASAGVKSVQGQKALTGDNLLKSQMLADKNAGADNWKKFEAAQKAKLDLCAQLAKLDSTAAAAMPECKTDTTTGK